MMHRSKTAYSFFFLYFCIFMLYGNVIVGANDSERPCHLIDPISNQESAKAQGFFPVTMERGRELIVDAMLTADFAIKKDKTNEIVARRGTGRSGGFIGGVVVPVRGLVYKKGDPTYRGSGGELLTVRLENAEEDGVAGIRISLLTKKTQLVKKKRQAYWGNAILEVTHCLHRLLDIELAKPEQEELSRLSREISSKEHEIVLPEDMPVKLLLRRSLFSERSKGGERIVFQVAEDLIVNDVLVVKKGQRGIGRVTEARGGKIAGVGGKLNFTIDSVDTIGKDKLNMRFEYEALKGSSAGSAARETLLFGFLAMGDEVGLLAGTECIAVTDGEKILQFDQ